MSGAKNVIDMRPGKGFTTSQSNEHLRRLADREAAKKARVSSSMFSFLIMF